MYNNIPFPNSHTWYPRPSLSTSSISISGFSVCTFFKLCITLPGIAPTYVLLCPFISATSVIPPTLNLKYYQTHTHTHTVIVVLVYCIVLLLYLMPGLLNELYYSYQHLQRGREKRRERNNKEKNINNLAS